MYVETFLRSTHLFHCIDPFAGMAPPYSVQDAEEYELLSDGTLPPLNASHGKRPAYRDGSTIDWLWEEGAERERKRILHSQPGLRGAIAPILDSSRMWLVSIFTGICIGIAGACLDVLVKW